MTTDPVMPHSETTNTPVFRPRIYLAGPEVFHPDAGEIGKAKCRLCADHGLDGVFPLDIELTWDGLGQTEHARRIALANEALIRSCDAMIANLTPFRGVSADSGTAFEVGFMRALAKPVFGYTNVPASFASRCRTLRGSSPLPFDCDQPDHHVEDFDFAENLMIAVAVTEGGATIISPAAPPASPPRLDDLATFEYCLSLVARHLKPSG